MCIKNRGDYGLKEIVGYWNVYTCDSCKIEFAISQEKDQKEVVYCPSCQEDSEVEFCQTDFIER